MLSVVGAIGLSDQPVERHVPPRYQAPCMATFARTPPSSRSVPVKRLKPNRLASVNSKSRLSSFG